MLYLRNDLYSLLSPPSTSSYVLGQRMTKRGIGVLICRHMSGLENRDYGRRGPAALTMRPLYPQKLALTSPTSGGRSVSIVRSRTKATELELDI
jgi:hypothetical protein